MYIQTPAGPGTLIEHLAGSLPNTNSSLVEVREEINASSIASRFTQQNSDG